MALVVMNVNLESVFLAFLAVGSTEYMVAIQRLKVGVHSTDKAMCFILLEDTLHLLTPHRFESCNLVRRFRWDAVILAIEDDKVDEP